ncbi:MAG: hypothetical protein ACRDQ4_20535 [Pseudonocardiaceae bacterium]
MRAVRPHLTSSPALSRRRFLIAADGAGAAVALAGCGSSAGSLTGTRIGPRSTRVMQVEPARQAPGQRTVEMALDAVSGPVDIGGRTVTTWTYGGESPGKEIRVRRGDLLSARSAVVTVGAPSLKQTARTPASGPDTGAAGWGCGQGLTPAWARAAARSGATRVGAVTARTQPRLTPRPGPLDNLS